MNKLVLCAATLLLLICSSSVWADPITFSAILLTSQEIPAPSIPAGFNPSGTATAIFDPSTNQLKVTLNWTGLTSSAVAAHIHSGLPTGPVIIPFFSTPMPTSGTFTATLTLTSTQAAALISGLQQGTIYFNIHTERNPSGEIRGNVGTVVPEPATLLLLGTGLAGLAVRVRRKSKRVDQTGP